MHLYRRAADLLHRLGLLEAVLQLRRAVTLRTISIVTYHRIADLDDDDPYDPEVIDATPAQFRRHVEMLARIGTPIGIDTLIRALDGGTLPPNPVMITFDDGYRSCREVALPILRRLGVPATVFVATAFADQRRLYWWDQIAAVLHLARGRRAELAYPHPLRIDTNDPGTRRRLTATIKNTRGLDLDRFLRELRAALRVPWSPELEARLAASLIMSWDDIRALANAGLDVESHSRDHRVLETLDGDALCDDLVGSRRDLEAQLGRPVRAIAYPVGRRPPARVRRAVAEAGYQIGLTNATGVNYLWPEAMRPVDPFDLRRIATDRSHSDAMFLAQLAVPPLAYGSLRLTRRGSSARQRAAARERAAVPPSATTAGPKAPYEQSFQPELAAVAARSSAGTRERGE
ncbi:MAG TPA: polysaccharide deacetylase family protein [Kofleriaceae bacterium]|nr:polysaccharide deacetylase family protein [Kofleriaceae bacterium]